MKNLLLLFFTFTILQISAQQLNMPNFAWASHPMRINKIEQTSNATIIELSITNQRALGGSFCADKNIYIMDVLSGKKYYMQYSKGIPVCPDNYKFSSVGEELSFQLYFPKLPPDIKYINIIEDCNNYCFSISGVILSNEFNSDVNLGYQYYTEDKTDFALFAFKKVIENYPDYPFGKFYLNIIQIYAEKGDYSNAKIWFNKLKALNFLDKATLMEQLQKAPYYSKLIF